MFEVIAEQVKARADELEPQDPSLGLAGVRQVNGRLFFSRFGIYDYDAKMRGTRRSTKDISVICVFLYGIKYVCLLMILSHISGCLYSQLGVCH